MIPLLGKILRRVFSLRRIFMCTAITYKTKDHYFGRTLDLEYHYSESVTVVPRRYSLEFRCGVKMASHYAMIGMATVAGGYPLYYDAVNEKGLGAAGLAFWKSAKYCPSCTGRDNIASFELIPWVLSQCDSVIEARELLGRINITSEAFSAEFPPSPLHWLIADREEAIVLEQTADGINVYENTAYVLTNEPPFDFQMMNLNNFLSLTADEPTDRFAEGMRLFAYSRGMGAMGLPGDSSSQSRFVRGAFTRLNSVSGEGEEESLCQLFHILGSVEQVRGCVRLLAGKYEKTVYTSVANADKGIYYYTTYENSRITAVDMHRENLDGESLVSYPLIYNNDVKFVN